VCAVIALLIYKDICLDVSWVPRRDERRNERRLQRLSKARLKKCPFASSVSLVDALIATAPTPTSISENTRALQGERRTVEQVLRQTPVG